MSPIFFTTQKIELAKRCFVPYLIFLPEEARGRSGWVGQRKFGVWFLFSFLSFGENKTRIELDMGSRRCSRCGVRRAPRVVRTRWHYRCKFYRKNDASFRDCPQNRPRDRHKYHPLGHQRNRRYSRRQPPLREAGCRSPLLPRVRRKPSCVLFPKCRSLEWLVTSPAAQCKVAATPPPPGSPNPRWFLSHAGKKNFGKNPSPHKWCSKTSAKKKPSAARR